MVRKKRVVMEPVKKGKVDPAIIKKAVHEVASRERSKKISARRVAKRAFIDELFTCVISDSIERAKNTPVLIAFVRKEIIRLSKKHRISRRDMAALSVSAVFAFFDQIHYEALRPQKKASGEK